MWERIVNRFPIYILFKISRVELFSNDLQIVVQRNIVGRVSKEIYRYIVCFDFWTFFLSVSVYLQLQYPRIRSIFTFLFTLISSPLSPPQTHSFWIIYIILFYCIYFHLSSFTRSIKYKGKSLLDQSPSLLSSPFSLFEIKIELKNSLNLEINQCSSYFFVPSLNLLESISSIFKSLLPHRISSEIKEQ